MSSEAGGNDDVPLLNMDDTISRSRSTTQTSSNMNSVSSGGGAERVRERERRNRNRDRDRNRGRGGNANCSIGDVVPPEVDWILRFVDSNIEDAYQEYMKKNRHSALKWMLYFAGTCFLCPIIIQRQAIQGTYGHLVQVSEGGLIVSYVFNVLISFTSIAEGCGRSWLWIQDYRQAWKSIFVVLNGICTSLSLLCRTKGHPCLPNETIWGMQFCNPSPNGLISSDGFVAILALNYFYMHLMPVSFAYNMTSWLISFLLGTLASAYYSIEGSKVFNALFGNLLLLVVHLSFPILLYRQEKKHMSYFLAGARQPNPKIKLTREVLDEFNRIGAIHHIQQVGRRFQDRYIAPYFTFTHGGGVGGGGGGEY